MLTRPRVLLALALAWAVPAPAQDTAAGALALVKTYIERHNGHDLAGVLELYDDDAVFYLSMGRPPVYGRDAIEGLERFDVAAQSTLYPQDLRVERDGALWRVHLGGVIEHSEIFEAAGVAIVMAQGIDNGFVLTGGKIVEIHQPELEPACSEVVLSAFRGVVRWLLDRGDARRQTLVENDFIRLTPETIPEVVQALREWRQVTGMHPPPALVAACARFDPLAR